MIIIIITNDGLLWNVPLRTNFTGILRKTEKFSVKKINFKMSSVKWRPFCLGMNELLADTAVQQNRVETVYTVLGSILIM